MTRDNILRIRGDQPDGRRKICSHAPRVGCLRGDLAQLHAPGSRFPLTPVCWSRPWPSLDDGRLTDDQWPSASGDYSAA